MAKRRYNSKNRQRTLSSDYADSAPAYRWQHSARDYASTDSHGILAERALEECMLDRWFLAGYIDETEHTAGLRLREDYLNGQVPARTCRLYDPASHGSRGVKLFSSQAERRSHHAEEAYQRWRHALRLVGARGSLLLNALCCEDKSIAPLHRADVRHALQILTRYYR